MLKLLLCLLVSVLTGACLMQLRQQRLELNHQTSLLHNQIESQHAKMWNQQLQIARVTAPPALRESIGKQDVRLAPLTPTEMLNSTSH